MGEFLCSDTQHDPDVAQSEVWLAPYDLGVSQKVRIESVPSQNEHVAELQVRMEHLAGEPSHWVRLNGPFLASIRRQFIAWRS